MISICLADTIARYKRRAINEKSLPASASQAGALKHDSAVARRDCNSAQMNRPKTGLSTAMLSC